MKKFIIDFEGEEDYINPMPDVDASARFPIVLYMIPFGTIDSQTKAFSLIRKYTSVPFYLVKYRRKPVGMGAALGMDSMYCIGFTHSSLTRDVIAAINNAGREQTVLGYTFTVYYDDDSAPDIPDYPDPLGRDHTYREKNEFDFIEIYAGVDSVSNITSIHLSPGDFAPASPAGEERRNIISNIVDVLIPRWINQPHMMEHHKRAYLTEIYEAASEAAREMQDEFDDLLFTDDEIIISLEPGARNIRMPRYLPPWFAEGAAIDRVALWIRYLLPYASLGDLRHIEESAADPADD